MGILYLIPNTLGQSNIDNVLPSYNISVAKNLRHFIVENVRSARRFLKMLDRDIVIGDLSFYELNRHTPPRPYRRTATTYIRRTFDGYNLRGRLPCNSRPGSRRRSHSSTKEYTCSSSGRSLFNNTIADGKRF